MTIVRLKHLRPAGICPAAKNWFDDNNIDWKDFVLNGVDADILLATEDPRAIKVVEIARGEE